MALGGAAGRTMVKLMTVQFVIGRLLSAEDLN
jgi:hypothetical protein